MKTRRWIAAGVLVPGLMAGCAGKVEKREWLEPAQSAQPAPEAPQQAQEKPGDKMDASAGTAEAIAAKTQSYLKDLNAMVEARQRAPQPPAAPSQVQWMEAPFADASDLRLGGLASSGPNSAEFERGPVRPVIDTTPIVANQPPEPSDSAPVIGLARAPEPQQTREQATGNSPLAVADAIAAPSKAPTLSGIEGASLRLDSRLKDSPRDVWTHTEFQLLRMIKNEPTPDLSTLASLPPEDRELVTALVDGLTNFRNALRQDSNMLLSAKVRPILEMADRLRSQAELTIPKLVLCKKVDQYGVYEPLEPARFPAGKDHRIAVYCEVANFLSSLNARQMWETQFQWDMTLFTEQSIPVWSDQTGLVTDESRTRRHDQFLGKVIALPPSLPVGKYLLKVTIVDKQSNRIAEATAPLVVVAQ